MAESFGDLDPRIDARENDVPARRWGGFHRIEKALWEEGSAAGMAPVARRLRVDVEELRAKVSPVGVVWGLRPPKLRAKTPDLPATRRSGA